MAQKVVLLKVVNEQEREIGRFPVHEGENLVGIPVDGPEPEIDLEPFDKDQVVSRRHAIIRRAGGDYTIEQLGKTNPTHVNTVQLKPGEKSPLKISDRITFARRIHAKLVEEDIPTTDSVPPTST
ncbi:MAG: FHA domain-containing protein [Planctomycetes bacterium]|nr:FHA domain-containing protein [Planctomycetota bacterium]